MADASEVIYEYGEIRIDPEDSASVASRMVRRLLLAEGKKARKRFSDLVHPETGERPGIVVHITRARLPSVQIRLVTASPVLREWLLGRGVVIGEAPYRDGEGEGAAPVGVSSAEAAGVA